MGYLGTGIGMRQWGIESGQVLQNKACLAAGSSNGEESCIARVRPTLSERPIGIKLHGPAVTFFLSMWDVTKLRPDQARDDSEDPYMQVRKMCGRQWIHHDFRTHVQNHPKWGTIGPTKWWPFTTKRRPATQSYKYGIYSFNFISSTINEETLKAVWLQA